MFKSLLALFLLAHILGDFYWQSAALAKNKESKFSALLWHGLLYYAAAILCLIPFYSPTLFIVISLLAALHLTVDIIKQLFTKKSRNKTALYITDQLLHLSFIFVATVFLSSQGYDHRLLTPVDHVFSFEDVSRFYTYLCLMLLIIKPANITIKQLLWEYRPLDSDNPGIKNAGAFIGILERIIILLFLYMHQYSAIGLVLTAKSVARYNRIAEDKQFAEYYLLGTLLSTLFVIAGYLVLT